MPLYEYQCDACAHRFELIQKFSDPPPAACPKCGGAVTKLMSSPAIQFKGSGFYLTDYGRGGKSDAANAKGGKSEGGTSGGDTKASDSGSKSSEGGSKSSEGGSKSESGAKSSEGGSKSSDSGGKSDSGSKSSEGGSSTKSDSSGGASPKPSAPSKVG